MLAAAPLQIHFDVGERAKSLHAAVSTFQNGGTVDDKKTLIRKEFECRKVRQPP